MKLNIKLALIIWAAFVFQGCSKKELSEVDTGKLNLVFILVDTLRADHLPFYGYNKDTAPFLHSLAKESIVFDNAFSTCSYTAPATASIFSSMFPSQHGVITGHFANLKLQKGSPSVKFDQIPEEITTLGEEMSSNGFNAFGLADNLNIAKTTGFAQGFSKFVTYEDKGSRVMNQTLMEWKPEIENSDKYFLYIHYMDPHAPYLQKAPWYKPGTDEKSSIINAYDSEIADLDSQIERMFAEFGWKENSIVVFTSDHGEEFWEHGYLGHSRTLYREVINVPLFIYVPGAKSKRINNLVTTMDILPTLAGLLNLPKKENWEGVDLTTLMKGQTLQDRSIFGQLLRRSDHPKPEVLSTMTPDWHYLGTKPKGKGVTHELYNARLDKKETKDLSSEKPEMVKDLSEKVANAGKGKTTYETITVEKQISQEGLDQLKTLGYAE